MDHKDYKILDECLRMFVGMFNLGENEVQSAPDPTSYNMSISWFLQMRNCLDDAISKMKSYEDLLFNNIQSRVDQGLPLSFDDNLLISDLNNVLIKIDSNAIPGYKMMFAEFGIFCEQWINRYEKTFRTDVNFSPGKRQDKQTDNGHHNQYDSKKYAKEARREMIKRSSHYHKKVDEGIICNEWDWNGTIVDLAFWLSDNGLISRDKKGFRWFEVNELFRINGKPITNEQLKGSLN